MRRREDGNDFVISLGLEPQLRFENKTSDGNEMKQEIIIVNPKDFEKVKKKISEEGVENFHVLSDFDKTLTTLFLPSGERVNSLISILRNGNYLDEDYVKRAKELYSIYHPIEVDPNVNIVEKKKKMYEWWDKHFILLGKKGLDLDLLKKCADDIINNDLLILRAEVDYFVNFLDKKNIPLLIISASIGDLIKEYLKKKGLLTEDIFVISNELEYNSKGKFSGVKSIVHVLNKDESSVKNFPKVYEKVKNRKNILLLGDGVGDVDMIRGFEYNNLIKIGFYNDKGEGSLEQFKENFDVVLTGDQDFNFINNLVKEIFK